MKIHTLANPPPGITFDPLTVETVNVLATEAGVRRVLVKFRTSFNEPVTATFTFANANADTELPSVGDTVNYSFWRPAS